MLVRKVGTYTAFFLPEKPNVIDALIFQDGVGLILRSTTIHGLIGCFTDDTAYELNSANVFEILASIQNKNLLWMALPLRFLTSGIVDRLEQFLQQKINGNPS